MPRKKTKVLQRHIQPDRKYDSVLVQRFINKVMQDGKKLKAERIVYDAFQEVERRTNQQALEVFQQAIENAAPSLEVKSRRVGGANYQVPFEVHGNRRTHLVLMWMVQAVRGKSGQPTSQRIADEIINAYNETGDTFKKKEDSHRMAEANRAFAHLARF
ncbi:30S ribosomal protein S7 [Candidatus Saccharibacteria bacterium QS_5_54_17]|nr:MAG: 30S ribosomal protein S7 [Candidatus Saccharibacteria bacterium QS_5_54_17]PSO43687.1 MAG: 30S ribosomal protein S7 [Candidatus Saccharibacteria bacterium QS_8_54_8]